jgi:hypothetical protein
VKRAAFVAVLTAALGCADSKRIEPEDGPATREARARLESAAEQGAEVNEAVAERNAKVIEDPAGVAEANAELAAEGADWQRARAAALARTQAALSEMDRRLAALQSKVASANEPTAATALDRAREARAVTEQRLGVLQSASEATFNEARRQLENAIDTMNEAGAQAETVLAKEG